MSAPTPADTPTRRLAHGRIELALWTVRAGDADRRPLLLLHGLGEATPTVAPAAADRWPGPVLGLDFTGHGASTVPAGGGYTSEILVADADRTLAEVGPVTVLGRGLGAYIGLLLAGARPDTVRGVVLTDGPGLVGGGVHPGSPSLPQPTAGLVAPPDPWALVELARDVRPPDYAVRFARYAVEHSGIEEPVAVGCVIRPEWLDAVLGEPGVVRAEPAAALARFAALD